MSTILTTSDSAPLATSTADTGGSAITTGGGVPATPSWKDSLPTEIKSSPMFNAIDSVETLAKSYMSAQEMVGKKGIIPPTEKSTDEDWGKFYDQVGRPALDKYEVALPKDAKVNPEFVKEFKELAHKTGLLPKQAQALVEWQLGKEKALTDTSMKAMHEQRTAQIDGLKKEWGDGFVKNIKLAQMAAKEAGGDEFLAYLDHSGLGDNPMILKTLANIGKMMGEDKIRGESTAILGQSADEIKKEIGAIMSNNNHPYFKGNPQAVAHMAKLNQALHGS